MGIGPPSDFSPRALLPVPSIQTALTEYCQWPGLLKLKARFGV